MALIVKKFGGTSVGSIERIQEVAKLVMDARAKGDQIVVVVSAMSGETNRLVELATKINPIPYSREYDLLIASGEQVSVGLVSLALNTLAGKTVARGLLGHQIGIRTDSVFSKARIQAIDSTLLKREIENGITPVIAGFQGVDSDNNITTLGRGGSDTSAVAIAAAIQADECDIYTDVDGVYTTDPRLCPQARKIQRISYEEMMEFAGLGAKVLQIRSVEIAAKYRVNLHVRSSFERTEGTRVVAKEDLGSEMEKVVVAGVAADPAQVKLTLQNLPDTPGTAAQIFGALSEAAIVVDVIVQTTAAQGKLSVSFTVGKTDHLKAQKVLQALAQTHFVGMQISEDAELAKVSIVGVGMQNHPGVAAKMFRLLADAGINIRLVTTSEIKVSCLIAGADTKKAVSCLHQGFELDKIG
ncbi:MAG: aspartate kinase [Bacteriovoracia bacterium]